MSFTAVPGRPAPGENRARGSELLNSLFPPSVISSELREPADSTLLFPEEAGSCGAVRPKRLEEFAAGRLCARRALGMLGISDFALRANADRTPCWPEGIVGSITHTVGFCGAVAGRRTAFAGLGVDAEIVARVAAELWREFLTPAEFAGLALLGAAQREAFAALAFSAKEAFYKAQFGLTGGWLDFADVSVEVIPQGSHAGAFAVRAASTKGRWILRGLVAQGRYRFEGPLVVTGVALRAADAALLAPRTLVANL